MTLLELAAKVEAAEGPDRRLDAEIDCAIRFPDLRPAEPDDFAGEYGYSPGNIKVDTGFLMSESYTGSVDAAMMLVPEGWLWELSFYFDHAEAVLRQPYDDGREIRAATPALALTAASLRARSENPA